MSQAVSPLLLKLRYGTELSVEDERHLEALCTNARRVAMNEDLAREGDRPDDVHLVMEGFAYRYKLLADGRRQILAFLLPGDFCDMHVALLGAMDHCISTLTPCCIVDIPRSKIEKLIDHPRLLRGFWWATLVDEAVLREWLVNMGQRSSERQMAHFYCEMFVRLSLVGLVDGDSFELPLTQQELADVLGRSVVHTNRTLQNLRTAQLVEVHRTRVKVPDVEKLFAFAGFNPNYLHLTKRIHQTDASHYLSHNVGKYFAR